MNALGKTALTRYALLALPLAFAALPLYVFLPQYYSEHYGVSLALIGSLLLAARLGDAIADPFIGRYVDRVLSRSAAQVFMHALAAGVLMCLGFAALWWAPQWATAPLMAWLAVSLAITYVAYSFLTVLHQGYGTQLSAHTPTLSRISAYREGATLLGVIIASVLPAIIGAQHLPWLLGVAMLMALWSFKARPLPDHPGHTNSAPPPILSLATSISCILNNVSYKSLCIVYVFNGIAAAVPATLLLFFLQDRLQVLSPAPYLLAYFVAAAASLPLWLKLVSRVGLERAWLVGMLLAVIAFIAAGALQAGDSMWFMGVCVGTGIAAGADLALPNAMVARSIHAAGHSGQLEGSYFGVWGFLTKLNLALAAGLSLPLLQWLGYAPGARDAQALNALAIAYCWVPCVLKLLAAVLLWRLFIAPTAHTSTPISHNTSERLL
jgi:glycoside/pentoside/hexuronide:cation symporter, GPH family